MPKPVPAPRPAKLRSATPALPSVYRPNAALPVQAKLTTMAPKPQPLAPPPFKPHARPAALSPLARPSATIQRAENIPKSIGYSSIALHYTPEQIALAAQQTGHNTGYTGHQSGGPGDGMNSGTVKANKEIVEQLQKNVAKEKQDKKKAPVRQDSPKSARWRALNKAKLLMTEALKPNPIGRPASLSKASKEYQAYLTARTQPGTNADDLLTAQDVEDCNDYWDLMEAAEEVMDYDA